MQFFSVSLEHLFVAVALRPEMSETWPWLGTFRGNQLAQLLERSAAAGRATAMVNVSPLTSLQSSDVAMLGALESVAEIQAW